MEAVWCMVRFQSTSCAETHHTHLLFATTTGVDISKARTHVCKNLMMRHLQHQLAAGKQVPESVLICADGATFEPTGIRPGDVVFDARVAMEEQVVTAAAAAAGETTRKRLNKSSTARLAKRIRDKYMPDGKGRESECEAGEDESKEARLHEDGFYDRVLVDAECTHDGSIRHMEAVTESDVVPADDRPQQRNGSIRQMKPGAAAKFADHCNGDGIVELQRRLLTNGFRLLRAGGVLVYSTCSLTIAQNEDMVQWFLESHPNASLLPLDAQRYVQHAYEPLPPSQYDEAVEVAANQMTSLFDAGDEEQLFQLISRSDIADNPNVAQAVCERFAARPTAPEKKPAMLAGTLRFEPAHGTSGLFVAKFRKSANLKHQQQVEEVTGSTSHSEHVSSR